MACKEIREQLAIYRELTEAERRAVQEHLDGCPVCAAILEQFEAQDQELAALRRLPVRREWSAQVLAQTVGAPAQQRRPRRWLSVLLSTALVLVLALSGAVGASADALPGDALYPVKRVVEDARLHATLNTEAREAYRRKLAERRRVEVRAVINEERDARVTFEGELEAVEDGVWVVEGLPVAVPPAQQQRPPAIGSQVAVVAEAQSGALSARTLAVRTPTPPLHPSPDGERPTGEDADERPTAAQTLTPIQDAVRTRTRLKTSATAVAPVLDPARTARATRFVETPALAKTPRVQTPTPRRQRTPRETPAWIAPGPRRTRRPTVGPEDVEPTRRRPTARPTSRMSTRVPAPVQTRIATRRATGRPATVEPRQPTAFQPTRQPTSRMPTRMPSAVATRMATHRPTARSVTRVPTSNGPTRAPSAVQTRVATRRPTNRPRTPEPARPTAIPPTAEPPVEVRPTQRASTRVPTAVPPTAEPQRQPTQPAPTAAQPTAPPPEPTAVPPTAPAPEPTSPPVLPVQPTPEAPVVPPREEPIAPGRP